MTYAYAYMLTLGIKDNLGKLIQIHSIVFYQHCPRITGLHSHIIE